MLDCLILGDSIAFGTHQVKPECVAIAKSGINSENWNRTYGHRPELNLDWPIVVISLGSNDHRGIHTRQELENLRSSLHGKNVFWILPAIKPQIQQIVKDIAAAHNDHVIPIRSVSPDQVHPTAQGYREISNQIR